MRKKWNPSDPTTFDTERHYNATDYYLYFRDKEYAAHMRPFWIFLGCTLLGVALIVFSLIVPNSWFSMPGDAAFIEQTIKERSAK